VAVLDLTAIGQNLTPEQWYDGMMTRIGRQLKLEAELEQFWQHSARLSPVQRFFTGLHDVVMKVRPGKLVIFVDESDTVRSLPFSTDEFFAAVRECYNRRAEEPAFQDVTFCLLGVATPSDLIRDSRLTPFNIGCRIDLTDFTAAEAGPLAAGLPANANALLERVFHWTGGHPYLTQKLCLTLLEQSASSGSDVDRICAETFLTPGARERDDNLVFVRERMLNVDGDRAALLYLYARILRGKPVKNDETDPLVSLLKLSGIARPQNGSLQSRNRIYAHVFDRKWCRLNMPEAEVRRQRTAFRRGVVRTAVAVTLLMGLLALPLFAPAPPRDPAEAQGLRKVNLAPLTTNATVSLDSHLLVIAPKSTNQAPTLVLEVGGRVEFLPANSGNWYPCPTNQPIYPGDMLRTGLRSRAAIRMSDLSVVRVGEASYLRIPDHLRKRSALDLMRGVFYFFERGTTDRPVDTPQGNVTIKG